MKFSLRFHSSGIESYVLITADHEATETAGWLTLLTHCIPAWIHSLWADDIMEELHAKIAGQKANLAALCGI
jgi:hypothetical protein